MPIPVTCPFCRSAFTVPVVPPARRTPCPTCGESAPVSADAATPTPAASPTPAAVAGRADTPKVVFASLGLTALIVAGFALWFFFTAQAPPAPPAPPPPPVVTTPRAVTGLKFIPKDAQLVVAVQPAALDEYAKTHGRTADALLAEVGVPEDLLATLRDAGLPPAAVQSLVLAANVDDLRAVLVLTLREPLKDDGKFRDALKIQGRDPATVDLGGFPLLMAKANDRTYVFALNDAGLTAAKTPTAGYADLRPQVRESIDKLDPASVAWVATDNKDWAKLPQWKLLGDRGPSGLVKKLDGVRAVAAGVSLEPTLYLRLSVRVNDSTAARDTADSLRARLTDLRPAVVPRDEWADAELSLEPTAETLPKLKAALRN